MKKFLVRWLIAMLLMPGVCFAQSSPTAVQKSVSGIIQQKMANRGFASNDPRWSATLQTAGSTIAGAAAAAAVVTAAGITAPAWITAAGTVALGALLGTAIDLAVDGVRWLLNSDGSVTYSGPATSPTAPMSGQWAWTGNYGLMGAIWSSNPDEVQAYQAAQNGAGWHHGDCQLIGGGARYNCVLYNPQHQWMGGIDAYYQQMTSQQAAATAGCAGLYVGGACQASQLPPTQPSQVTKSPTEAANDLTPAEKGKPVNPEVLAKIADAAWQKAAAQPGYQGVPYDASNPITSADASAWRASNPSSWPTVGDMVSPQAVPSGQAAAAPWQLPNSAADPVTAPTQTPAVTPSAFDWAIPNMGETIPKQSVPISYTPTVFAAPTGCPAPITFVIFGKEYAISYTPFCDLMATVAPIFLAIGAAAAALIFAESLRS